MLTPFKIIKMITFSQPLYFFLFVLMSFLLALTGIAIPWFLKNVIDMAIENHHISHINEYGLYLLGLCIGLYFTFLLNDKIVGLLIQKGVYHFRQIIYQNIINKPYEFTQNIRPSEIVHHLMQDVFQIEKNMFMFFKTGFFHFFLTVGILVLMWNSNHLLSLSICCFLFISLGITLFIGKPLGYLNKRVQKKFSHMQSKYLDIFQGLYIVKNFGQETVELEALDQLNEEYTKIKIKLISAESFLTPVGYLMEIIGVIIVIWIGAYLILKKQITPGYLLAFLMYAEILAEPFSRIFNYIEWWKNTRVILQRLSSFLIPFEQTPSSYFKNEDAPNRIENIVMQNINFKYPNTTNLILHDINICAQKGSIIGLIGKNGSGKTTLMDLLLGFHQPSTGEVLVNGRSIFDFSESSWRKKIGVLSQEPYLFNETILKNICYSNEKTSMVVIKKAISDARLDDLIQKLPMGLNTVIGEKDGKFSGGERKKIALARLLIKNPEIIIFDELSNHLDHQSLQEILEIIQNIAENKMIFIIDHRLSFIKKVATQMIQLENGHIKN